jgi:hypothetical protein
MPAQLRFSMNASEKKGVRIFFLVIPCRDSTGAERSSDVRTREPSRD